MTNDAPAALLSRLRSGSRFLLTSHINPDGDAIGSALGTARILTALGNGAVVWNRDTTPGIYGMLAGAERIHTGMEPPAGFPEAFDTSIVLECPSLDRTGLEESLTQLPILNLDHHLGNEHYGEVNWVDASAPSLGEMIHRLARGLRVELDPTTATCLYLTLVTDTGGFRFANASSRAFSAAAALVDEGAQPEEVSKWLHESRPAASLMLLGEMLRTLERHHGDRIATAVITQEMFEGTGAAASDSEGLIDYPRSIEGVDAVALIREVAPGRFKVSLRSRGDIAVERIARAHGGGGHKNAAGFAMDGELSQVLGQVVQELQEILD